MAFSSSKSAEVGDSDPVPSYEESVGSGQTLSDTFPRPVDEKQSGLPLQTQLANIRSQRIQSILHIYIDPLLLSQGASGIYKTMFFLIPSNIRALQHSSEVSTPKDEIIGFPSNENVKLVRLRGEEHTLEFWRQPAVIAELESSLKARLAASGHKLEQVPVPSLAPPVGPESPGAPPERKSFWGRKKEKYVHGYEDPTLSCDFKLGWRADDEVQRDGVKRLGLGEVRVRVAMKEVCLRVENEMGLYETRRGMGVSVVVEVGS